jgi:hypothetical protein
VLCASDDEITHFDPTDKLVTGRKIGVRRRRWIAQSVAMQKSAADAPPILPQIPRVGVGAGVVVQFALAHWELLPEYVSKNHDRRLLHHRRCPRTQPGQWLLE